MGPDKKPTILKSVEVIKVNMQVTKSKKQGGRVGKQKEWGFDACHTTGVARWPNIECSNDWKTKDTAAPESGMDDADGGMALETKLNLKYGKTTKQKSGTKNSKNGKAKTKKPPKVYQYHTTRDRPVCARGKWHPILF